MGEGRVFNKDGTTKYFQSVVVSLVCHAIVAVLKNTVSVWLLFDFGDSIWRQAEA